MTYNLPAWIEYPKCNPYPEPTRIIYKDCKGEDVKWVQWHLARHGYNLPIDGSDGKDIGKFIGDIQKKHGLKEDRRCGPATRKELKK